jgi:hypothetical protein
MENIFFDQKCYVPDGMKNFTKFGAQHCIKQLGGALVDHPTNAEIIIATAIETIDDQQTLLSTDEFLNATFKINKWKNIHLTDADINTAFEGMIELPRINSFPKEYLKIFSVSSKIIHVVIGRYSALYLSPGHWLGLSLKEAFKKGSLYFANDIIQCQKNGIHHFDFYKELSEKEL